MAASAPCFLMSCTLPFVAFPVCLWRTCNNNSKHSTGTTTLTPTSLPTPQHQPRNHSTFATQNLSSPETRGSTNIVHSMSRSLHQVLVVSTTLSGKTHTSIILLSPPPITHICSIKLAAWRQHRAVHQTLLGTDWRCSIVISTYYFPWNIFAVPTTSTCSPCHSVG